MRETTPKLTLEFLTNRKASAQDWSSTITLGGLSAAAAVQLGTLTYRTREGRIPDSGFRSPGRA